MVCFGYIIVNTLYKGYNNDDDDDDNDDDAPQLPLHKLAVKPTVQRWKRFDSY